MATKWAVIDCETNIKSPIGENKASAFWPKNKIVIAAAKDSQHPGKTLHIKAGRKAENAAEYTLIGQNVKFDLHHLRKSGTFPHYGELRIWDTQTAEYLLTSQETRFASLDQLAKKYGGTAKDSDIKAYWDAGVDTADIPRGKLEAYLKEDVNNTEIVAAAQMQEAVKRGLCPLIMSQMDGLLAAADIEYNGMHLSESKMEEYKQGLEEEKNKLEQMLLIKIPKYFRDHVNLNSTKDIAAILFGGNIEWEGLVDGAPFKNGKPRKHKVLHSQSTGSGQVPSIYRKPEWKTPGDKWSTSEEVLKEIVSLGGFLSAPFCKDLLRYRFIQKEITTYADGLPKLVYPDGMLHGNIHTCSTHTGRYSSSAPNLQNLPSSSESSIRDCFTSRFGREGRIVTADFKQLEVVALAYLSRDRQLMQDIRDGRDIHFETGKLVFGWRVPGDMDPDKRRIVKTINFGLIYGGGPNTLAKQAGTTKDIAKACIEAFYSRYPEVKLWHNGLVAEVEKNAVSSGRVHNGIPIRDSWLKLCTGRRFVFEEGPLPWDPSGLRMSWPVNKIKNYPVQGLATGDIVPLLLGRVWREFQKDDILRSRALFVNVVHDEIVLDVHRDYLAQTKFLLKTTLESGPEIFEDTFGVEFDLPLTVDIHEGNSWGECKK